MPVAWIWMWRGVLLAAVLLAALPYSLPAREVWTAVTGLFRDGLVSRISRTTPHRFTPDLGFFSSVAVYVLPIVALLLAQVFDWVRVVLEPILGLFQ